MGTRQSKDTSGSSRHSVTSSTNGGGSMNSSLQHRRRMSQKRLAYHAYDYKSSSAKISAASLYGQGEKFDLSDLTEQRSKHSFHQGLVRERTFKDNFDKIYEIIEPIGQGGLCQIYKIKKKDKKVGGSSRSENVRRQSRKYFPGIPKPTKITREYSGDPSSSPLYYALKVINLALVKEDSIDSLKNEVEILKTLDHKNIINAYETFQQKASKKLMIVMELCTGGDLFARLPYTELQAARITRQVLSAISYLHSKSIIHRDLKFENVIFENTHADAKIKVIDFGLSKQYSPSAHILTERVGTLYSMSPETMQGIYTSQADLWSIGVITHMMLAGGEKPFEGQTPKQLVAKVLLGQYNFDAEIWSTVSDRAKVFVSELLVVEPERRLSAAQAMYHPWLEDATRHSIEDETLDEDFVERVRQCIIRYADNGEFQKLALNVIAKKSSSDDIFELRKVFDRFDTKNTGVITLEEFREALAQFDYSESDITKLFRKVDVNGNNVINYTEFLAAALETQGTIEEYRLAEAFDLMDTDDSGYISPENLREILGENTEKKYIDKLMAEADFFNDGRISYAEFLQVFSEKKQEDIFNMYEEAEHHLGTVSESTDAVLEDHGIAKKFHRTFGSVGNFGRRFSVPGDAPTTTEDGEQRRGTLQRGYASAGNVHTGSSSTMDRCLSRC